MLVSWKWLSRYVELTLSHDDLVERLSLSGLNHEGSETVQEDTVIDLEVTSNRGDCLGHIGVAREIAVLTDQPLHVGPVTIDESESSIGENLQVDNRFLDACPRYTARIIRGVRVAPSPQWLQDSLIRVGIQPVNNVVDATNYVLMECGQPLHAFDLKHVRGDQIVVRPADPGESLEAIDHRTYQLASTDCVIADAERPLAIAGVMGGADSEVTEQTTDLLIESAVFTPLSVRRTARRLKLHSASSFRFERRVDPAGVDWASRRVCQLITEMAGGKVDAGVIDTASELPEAPVVTLRGSEIRRVLGIEVPAAEVVRILNGLGCLLESAPKDDHWQCTPPSWRHDLNREVDLIEEVARIHGYDQIPEDAPIPVTPSCKRTFDVLTQRIRGVLTGAGFSEAMTPSVVTEKLDQSVSPWSDRPALQTRTAMLVGSKSLRRSLIPSLLHSRAANQASASLDADLFEIAHVYLPPASDAHEQLPAETYHLGLIGGDDFFAIKGVIETLLQRLGIAGGLQVSVTEIDGMLPGSGARLTAGDDDETLGFIGFLSPRELKQVKLSGRVVAAELSLDALLARANLVPQQQPVSPFPSIHRDLNLIVPESVRWVQLAGIVEQASGERLADLAYKETYRNAKQDGPDKKRLLFSMEFQSQHETLSGDDAEQLVEQIVGRCEQELDAVLLR